MVQSDWGDGGTDRAQGSRDRTATIADGLYACSHGREDETLLVSGCSALSMQSLPFSGPRVANRSTPPGEIRGPAGQPDEARHSFSMHGRAWKLELGIPVTAEEFLENFGSRRPKRASERLVGMALLS